MKMDDDGYYIKSDVVIDCKNIIVFEIQVSELTNLATDATLDKYLNVIRKDGGSAEDPASTTRTPPCRCEAAQRG